jgi:serine phosphatase RsbU (regulator of sigma subunit)
MYLSNKNLKLLFTTLLFSWYFNSAHAQTPQNEELLWNKYYSSKKDTNSIYTLIEISKIVYARDRQLSEKIANKAVYESKKLNHKATLAKALSRLTNVYFDNGKYEESYYLADELLKIATNVHDDHIYADACKIIGRRYHFRGEYPEALKFYLKSLSNFEKLQNKSEMSQVYNSMGGVYLNQKDYSNAFTYYHKAKQIQILLKHNPGIATGYLNEANVFIGEANYSKAKIFLDSAMYFYDTFQSEEGKAYVYATYSEMYIPLNKNDSALKNLLYGHKILSKLNKFYSLTQINNAIADLYLKLNDFKNALKYVNEGIEIATKTKQYHNIGPLFLLKSRILEKMNQPNEALQNYKQYKAFSDTVINAGNIRKQTEYALKYDYNKKEYQQQIEKQKLIAAQNEKETKQRFIINGFLIGLILILTILFLVIRSYRNNKRNSLIIAQQKTEVEKQHHLLQEKNKEVLDSINYAKRLQYAILPSNETIKKLLPNNFILYKPKDIVAGDFYWMELISTPDQTEQSILIAAADCTGHGVPGSIVSVVCSNALNRSVFEFGLTDPGEILNKTRELVIATFEKSDNEVKDGMDISLCQINLKAMSLKWAGANNPLWIIDQSQNFTEIKANKQPIGKYFDPKPFTTHHLKLNKGTRLYMFTDGYADQFGGTNGKKFKYKQLQDLLTKSSQLGMDEQKQIIEKTFENWKGNLEQVDDVCIIGIHI